MTRLTVFPPAKLNLMLHITGRREDGYHLLETVFQFIDLCDRLSLEVTDSGAIERADSDTPVAESEDILIKTAQLLQRNYKVEQGARIAIEKHIPIGGGLGGGSSNAAACLLALNQLWQLHRPLRELADLGLMLGADVPVFVHGNAAWATGVGEHLTPVQLVEPWYLVIYPGVAVSTAEIFNARQLTRVCDPITIRAFLEGTGTNVCEPVVREFYPAVSEALDWLDQHAEARLTGTGACIYAAFDSEEAAESVKCRVLPRWRAFIARGMNRNPVHSQCGIPGSSGVDAVSGKGDS